MMPKSTGTRSPFGVDEDVAGVHVGVEEAVAEHLLEEALGGACARIRSGSKPAAISAVALVRGDAADPLQGQHPARGALPVDPRHAKALVLGEVLGELRGGRRLEPQVHLEPGPGRDGLRPPRPA